MTDHARPIFRDLTPAEIERVLTRNHVGRIAFAFRGHPDIEPIHYVYDAGWIYGRTAPGTKLSTLVHHPWVAFEVDEIEGLFDWTSVVARGTVYLIDAEGSTQDREIHARAVHLLRELIPETLASDDPTPSRRALFRVHLDEVTGRTAMSGPRGGTPRGSGAIA